MKSKKNRYRADKLTAMKFDGTLECAQKLREFLGHCYNGKEKLTSLEDSYAVQFQTADSVVTAEKGDVVMKFGDGTYNYIKPNEKKFTNLTVQKYVPIPHTIEAIKFTTENNGLEKAIAFLGTQYLEHRYIDTNRMNQIVFNTKDGVVLCNEGNWIIKNNLKGCCYDMTPEQFADTYKLPELNDYDPNKKEFFHNPLKKEYVTFHSYEIKR